MTVAIEFNAEGISNTITGYNGEKFAIRRVARHTFIGKAVNSRNRPTTAGLYFLIDETGSTLSSAVNFASVLVLMHKRTSPPEVLTFPAITEYDRATNYGAF